ncbi:MAG: efflux RND transporter periplasmic adaptor subunit [Polyangiaceae bacterium]|nr:efflux RND transporter periplasmic adaptor subunit [Polyangiaceae bacterium]
MSAKPRRRRRFWTWALGLGVLVTAAVVVLRASGTERAVPVGAVVVVVERGVLAVDVLESGKIEPPDRVEVKSKIAGQVAAIGVEEGDMVRAGDVLLVLDPTDMKREVARAEAEALAAGYALEQAKNVQVRHRKGVSASVVAIADFEAADTDAKMRAASLRVANVALASARDKLRYTEIVAPIDGVVLERNVEPGEVVVPGVEATFDGRPLLTLGDVGKLEVLIDVDQIDVVKVRPGQRVEVRLDALRDQVLEAVVTRVAPASVRRQGRDVDVFPIKAELRSVASAIRPGMTADVRIRVDHKAGVLKLPMECVRAEGDKRFVTRISTGPKGEERLERVEIEMGTKTDREIEVLSGLAEGERVLLDPPPAGDNEMKL